MGESGITCLTARVASISKVQRIEHGRTSVRPGDVRELCRLYGVNEATTETLADLARATRLPDWWERHDTSAPHWFALYLRLEAVASRVSAFEPLVVHGLVQTRQYAERVEVRSEPGIDPALVQRYVTTRMARQQNVFSRDDPLQARLCFGEAALLTSVGSDDVLAAQQETSFGVLRPADAGEVYAHPRQEFRRLMLGGVLHRVATGYYAIVPPAAHDMEWLPSLEGSAYGIAAADYGPDAVSLMGLSAARVHGAVPRALGVAVVAAPKQRPGLLLADRHARVTFVRRATDRLEAERVSTDLGSALVTTVEQTLLDLAHRPDLGGVPDEAHAAVAALWSRADAEELDRIAADQRLRAALERARSWAVT